MFLPNPKSLATAPWSSMLKTPSNLPAAIESSTMFGPSQTSSSWCLLATSVTDVSSSQHSRTLQHLSFFIRVRLHSVRSLWTFSAPVGNPMIVDDVYEACPDWEKSFILTSTFARVAYTSDPIIISLSALGLTEIISNQSKSSLQAWNNHHRCKNHPKDVIQRTDVVDWETPSSNWRLIQTVDSQQMSSWSMIWKMRHWKRYFDLSVAGVYTFYQLLLSPKLTANYPGMWSPKPARQLDLSTKDQIFFCQGPKIAKKKIRTRIESFLTSK